MGCGCSKSKLTRGDRLKKVRSQQLQAQRKNIRSGKVRLSATNSSLTSKSSICLSCPESKQNQAERKRGIRTCRKSNRLINNIIRDPKFSCPLGKWRILNQ